VQVNINRSNPQAGFTLPTFMWRDALGPQQFRVLAECLQVGGCEIDIKLLCSYLGLASGEHKQNRS
jgi:hypothetical protein